LYKYVPLLISNGMKLESLKIYLLVRKKVANFYLMKNQQCVKLLEFNVHKSLVTGSEATYKMLNAYILKGHLGKTGRTRLVQ